MKSSMVAGVVALVIAAPSPAFAAGGGYGGRPVSPVFNAPHQGQGFNLQHQICPQGTGHGQVFANHGRRPFAGYGYYGGPYSTLSSGTFDSALPEDGDAGQVSPPVYGIPYYPPPPRPCVRPLLIHIGTVHHHGKLPRVVYGTPPDGACAG